MQLRVFVLTLALLVAACGGETVATTEGSNGASVTTVGTEPTTTATTVSTTASTECDPDGMSIGLTVLERSAPAAEAGKASMEDAHPGLTVNVTVFTTGSYLELAQTVVADTAVGRAPDVIETGLGLVTFVADGLNAQPIDDSLLAESYERRFLEAGTVDGNVYVVPWQVSTPLWFYNRDMYKEAGLDPAAPPTDYTEVMEHARALAEVTGAESVHMPATLVGDWFFQNAVQAGGGTLVGEDGLPAFDTEEGRRGLQLWSDTALEGLHVDVTAMDAIGLFTQGQIGMFAGSSSVLGSVAGAIDDSFEWDTFVHPTVDDLDPEWAIGGAGFSVLSDEPCKIQLATELIGHILRPEVVAEITRATGYMPVDEAARPLLEDFYAENPQWDYADDFTDPLVPWAGWRGERALEANLVLQDAMVRLTKGEDLDTVVAETAEEVRGLVGG